MKNLVIVESPAKAKTIEKYLGADFTVKSSMGHIRDLAPGDKAVDIKNGFKPKYVVDPDKKKLIDELKKLSSKAETVWLASDEDREGEAISWHLYDELNLSPDKTKRIVFNEITKPAILRAVENPREIDRFLVDAQQARRILDRLVGFELSPVLWSNVKPGLSAGRVQSVAVKLLVEREREINAFLSQSEYRVVGWFVTPEGKSFKADLSGKFPTEAQAQNCLESLKGRRFTVVSKEVKPAFRNPSAPFTTSTLQQEASRKLGYSVTRTMQLAQRLYENGHITYMRTDSTNLSQQALLAAKDYITAQFGAQFSKTRNYTTKNENAQEAHEAIRPTYFDKTSAGDDPSQRKLYELIWKRTIASQMEKAEMEKTIVLIESDFNPAHQFKAEGEVVKFEGFLKVYLESNDDEEEGDDEGMLPRMSEGENLDCSKVVATEKFSRPAPRYSEAALVKKLEELGIGRPSTYAPTISTIEKRGYAYSGSRDGQKRNYVEMVLENNAIQRKQLSENFGTEKNKLFPTDMGMIVTDFLQAHFEKIMDYGFTASVEKDFDVIAEGQMGWQEMLEEFYAPFHDSVGNARENATRPVGERILGNDPESGRVVLARMGRYGPIVQLGKADDGEPVKFVSLNQNQSIETVSLQEALKMFKLPKEIATYNELPLIIGRGQYGPYLKYNGKFHSLNKDTDLFSLTPEEAIAKLEAALSQPQFPIEIGEYEGEKLLVNKGRFGPYIKFGSLFVSIPRGENPVEIKHERAIQLIEEKKVAESKKVLKTFEEDAEIQILSGRYGPYIAYKGKNIPMPKGKEVEALTYADVAEVIKSAGNSEKPAAANKKGGARKATASRKAPAKKKK
jgi:DNA topoisomerase-1